MTAPMPHTASLVLFLVGPPGVGKTTLVRELLLRADPRGERTLVMKPKWTLAPTLALAGHYTGDTFDGADTVPYNGVADALNYWKAHIRPKGILTILDGDRFSHGKAFDFFNEAGAGVRVALLDASDDTLKLRRAARGSNQNASWLKGRETKSRKFAADFDAHFIKLDGEQRDTRLIADVLLKEIG